MNEQKRALLIGINGQIGFYMKNLLLEKGYKVHGLIRHSSTNARCPVELELSEESEVVYHYGDLVDNISLINMLSSIRPHEIYNLGSVSNARISFELSEYIQVTDGMGTLRILEAIRACTLTHFTRIYQAGSAELFGNVSVSPQDEETPFHPRSPYGISKQYSHWAIINYREAYSIHASNGITYNCESPRRGPDFVTRKITSTVARINRGLQTCLEIGNLDAKRDWSHAKDIVEGIWLVLQQDKGNDFVLSSGVARSVREFVEVAFSVVGIELVWIGERGSVNEIGVDRTNENRVLVKVNPSFFRPPELYDLRGNCEKARSQLQWKPTISFGDLVKEMVLYDLEEIDRKEILRYDM